MAGTRLDFFEILQVLADHDVDFIVVGGVCAVLHGAPVSTFDLDLVHSREESNLSKLLKALQALDAYFREHGAKRLRPTISHLASPGHLLLMTRAGPLDLLGTIGKGYSYDDLLVKTTKLSFMNKLALRLLDMETLISVKEETATDKDRAVLPILRKTLEEKKKSSDT